VQEVEQETESEGPGEEREGKEDEDMVDTVDDVIETEEQEENRWAYPIERKTLTRVQKACSTFCIVLLNQSVARKEYDSPLVCALAVSGVKEDGWKGPEQYPPTPSPRMSAFCAQDDGPFHAARQPWPHAVGVEFADA
jgi:hypothetical protein